MHRKNFYILSLLTAISFLFLLAGCNENSSGKKVPDTSLVNKDSIISQQKNSDTLLQKAPVAIIDTLSTSILKALKNKDYTQLAMYVHPQLGLRFSPYGHIDSLHHQHFSAQQLTELAKSGKKIKWGIYDGSGEPIILNINDYFNRFVYDVDFLNAEKRSVNKIASSGNTINNITTVYPAADFIEYYFSGFKKEYEGMDWKALRLVFSNYNNKPYLVAIIHDQWTI